MGELDDVALEAQEEAVRVVASSVQRGESFSRGLRMLPIPGIADVDLQHLHHVISGVISSFYLQSLRPAAARVQQRLREQLVPEPLVTALLPICARDPRYTLVLYRFGQVTIHLAEHPVLGVDLDPDIVDEQYSQEFLELVQERICDTASVPQVQCLSAPSADRFCHEAWPPGLPCPVFEVEGALGPRTDGSDSPSATDAIDDADTADVVSSGIERDEPRSHRKDKDNTELEKGERKGHLHLQQAPILGASLEAQGVTTLMIRNIPHTVTQKRFIHELANSGFSGTYDFCYMPSLFGTGVSKGYAFVNFKSGVKAFVCAWHGSRRFTHSGPALDVSAASIQGRETNLKKLCESKMRRIRNPALRPVVLDSD